MQRGKTKNDDKETILSKKLNKKIRMINEIWMKEMRYEWDKRRLRSMNENLAGLIESINSQIAHLF